MSTRIADAQPNPPDWLLRCLVTAKGGSKSYVMRGIFANGHSVKMFIGVNPGFVIPTIGQVTVAQVPGNLTNEELANHGVQIGMSDEEARRFVEEIEAAEVHLPTIERPTPKPYRLSKPATPPRPQRPVKAKPEIFINTKLIDSLIARPEDYAGVSAYRRVERPARIAGARINVQEQYSKWFDWLSRGHIEVDPVEALQGYRVRRALAVACARGNYTEALWLEHSRSKRAFNVKAYDLFQRVRARQAATFFLALSLDILIFDEVAAA